LEGWTGVAWTLDAGLCAALSWDLRKSLFVDLLLLWCFCFVWTLDTPAFLAADHNNSGKSDTTYNTLACRVRERQWAYDVLAFGTRTSFSEPEISLDDQLILFWGKMRCAVGTHKTSGPLAVSSANLTIEPSSFMLLRNSFALHCIASEWSAYLSACLQELSPWVMR
jgi:hypothetical protein